MDISNIQPSTLPAAEQLAEDPKPPGPIRSLDDPEMKKAFNDFVGQTFFGHLLSAMRKTVGKPAYFHGGYAEDVFRTQLDQVLAEELSNASAETFAEPMYELFTLPRP